MGLLRRLVRLANALAEDDEPRTKSGGRTTPRSRINYGVSVGPLSSEGAKRTERPQRTTQDTRYLTDVRHEGDDVLVTVDLPGVAPEDVSVAFDSETSTVEIRDGDEPVKRLGLEGEDATVTEATYNNHVLELRVSDGGSGDG